MEHRLLGSSGMRVSPLCLGTMTFGEADEKSFMHNVGAPEEVAFAIMDRAIETGVTFWDTADVYGQEGLSERVIGKWFASRKKRDDVVLATKCRFRMSEGPLGTGASRRRILAACEASLQRLGTDRIDLYQIHMQDYDTPEEETLRALDDLVRQGKVLYIGASNYAAYRLTDSLWESKTRNLERFVSLQIQYSLVERSIEREHVPLARKHGLGILPWSPLAAGFLSGKFRRGQPPPAGTRLDKFKERLAGYDNERNWKILAALDTIGNDIDASPGQIALAWLLRKECVTSVIFGARSVEQFDSNRKAADISLSDAHLAALDEASTFPIGYPYDFMRRVQPKW